MTAYQHARDGWRHPIPIGSVCMDRKTSQVCAVVELRGDAFYRVFLRGTETADEYRYASELILIVSNEPRPPEQPDWVAVGKRMLKEKGWL